MLDVLNPDPATGPHAPITPERYAEGLARQAQFPVGTHVHLVGGVGDLLVDHADNTKLAVYEVLEVDPVRRLPASTGGTFLVGPYWTLTTSYGGTMRRVIGERLRPAHQGES